MKNYITGILVGLLLSSPSLPGAKQSDHEKDIQRGSTLMGCLQESGLGGYVLTDGTGEGAMVLSKDGALEKHVGKWVKLDGDSIVAGGIEHFRARTATEIAATCDRGFQANQNRTATAELKSPQGEKVGTATLRQAPHGVLLKVELTEIPPGWHALHIHEKGSCAAPDFKSAGGHFNPHRGGHGFLAGEDHHAGDMPNFEAPASGAITVERINARVTLLDGRSHSLFGPEGTALVIHSGPDDYRSQPSGDAGERIACGVIEKAE